MKTERYHPKIIMICLVIALLLCSAGFSDYGFHPGNSDKKSYIVQGDDVDIIASLIEKSGGKVTSRLNIIHGVGALLDEQAVKSLVKNPFVKKITINGQTRLTDKSFLTSTEISKPATDYPDVTGADLVWGKGVNGSGVSVAVVDTGIAPHPGLLMNIKNKPNRIIGWADFVNHQRTPYDPNGHGTHVSGIIANTQIGSDKEWNGMAPGVNLVGVRVLDETGTGTYETVIQGIQWVVDHKDQYNIRVMNLSLLALVQSPYWADPLNQAVMVAWGKQITVVTVAGNDGPAPMSIGVPGNNPYVITVGVFTDNYTPKKWEDDYITSFSSTGPTLDCFVKPDVVAPGAHMVSTMMPGSYLARNHDANRIGGTYFSMAGSSQAAATVSGVAALILSRNPKLTPDQVKYRIMATAFPWLTGDGTDLLYSVWQQGAGRLNAYDAVMSDVQGKANGTMDIWADLAGEQHYEGYTYFDEETGQFKLLGEYNTWDGKFGAWSGDYGTWTGKFGAWSGNYGAWSGKFGAWSGNVGAWSGKFGAWSGKFGAWSGGYGAWSGKFGAWSGKFGAWSGSTRILDPVFVENFTAGNSPNPETSHTAVEWIAEP
jgi:serine protease AprX